MESCLGQEALRHDERLIEKEGEPDAGLPGLRAPIDRGDRISNRWRNSGNPASRGDRTTAIP